VAQQLPDDEIEMLQDTFRSLDRNGNGMLSPEDIKAGLTQRGVKVPPAMEDILKSIDCKGSGMLDYTEFIAATIDQRLCQREDVCWAAFRRLDLDGTGKITRDKLRHFLHDAGGQNLARSNTGKLDAMIREVDSTGDGAVNFEEFRAMMMPPPKRARRQSATR